MNCAGPRRLLRWSKISPAWGYCSKRKERGARWYTVRPSIAISREAIPALPSGPAGSYALTAARKGPLTRTGPEGAAAPAPSTNG